MGFFSGLGGLVKGGAGLLGMGSNPLGWALAGGQLLGGYMDQRSQNAAQQEAQRRYQELHGMIMGQMQGGPSSWEQQVQQLYAGAKPADTFNPMDYLNSPALRNSQDALMQMINRDPAAQLGQSYKTLTDLAQTGGASNTQSLIDSIQGLQNQDLGNQVAGLRGRAGSLGQRFGSAAGKSEALLRTQLGTGNNATLASILNQSNEANQGRRLGAAGQLGSLLQGAQGQRLGAIGQLQQQGQFGANYGLQGAQFNAQNMQNFIQQQLAALGLGSSMMGQRQSHDAGLLALLSGQPAQQAGSTQGLNDAAQTAAFLPMLLQQLQQMNQKRQGAAAPTYGSG